MVSEPDPEPEYFPIETQFFDSLTLVVDLDDEIASVFASSSELSSWELSSTD